MPEFIAAMIIAVLVFLTGLTIGEMKGREQVFTEKYVCAYDIGKEVRCVKKENLK